MQPQFNPPEEIIGSSCVFYSIGGFIEGLEGSGLIMQLNGSNDLNVVTNGAFTFMTELEDNTSYDVVIFQNPSSPSQLCEILNSSGTINSENINNIAITCDTIEFGNYIDNLDGTVTDTFNSLIWKKCSQGQNDDSECTGTAASFEYCNQNDNDCNGGVSTGILQDPINNGISSAYNTCNDLVFAGRSDWRVPTIEELKTLVYCSNGTLTPLPDPSNCGVGYDSPTINKLFPNTPNTAAWSATATLGYADSAWYMNFTSGFAYRWGYKFSDWPVRCVASGP